MALVTAFDLLDMQLVSGHEGEGNYACYSISSVNTRILVVELNAV